MEIGRRRRHQKKTNLKNRKRTLVSQVMVLGIRFAWRKKEIFQFMFIKIFNLNKNKIKKNLKCKCLLLKLKAEFCGWQD